MVASDANEEEAGGVGHRSMAGGMPANGARLIGDRIGNGNMRLQQLVEAENRIMSGPASEDSNEDRGEYRICFRFLSNVFL